jgi:large subunit ribosomal protein L21
MYAIFEDSGTQLKAQVGDMLIIDLRELPADAKSVTFERVLLVSGDKGATVGNPYLNGAKIVADIVEREFKDTKIDIVKYKRRKGFKKKQGHRQRYMRVKVTAINA